MTPDNLVAIHKSLSNLLLACQGGGLPESIDPDQLENVVKTQKLIEDILIYFKKRALNNQF